MIVCCVAGAAGMTSAAGVATHQTNLLLQEPRQHYFQASVRALIIPGQKFTMLAVEVPPFNSSNHGDIHLQTLSYVLCIFFLMFLFFFTHFRKLQ